MNQNYDDSAKFYDLAIDIDPNSSEAYVNKGIFFSYHRKNIYYFKEI